MKSLKELRENIKSTKELLLNSDTGGLVQHVNDSRIVYRENEYWLVDFKINNTIVIYIFNSGRVIVSYDYISSDYIEDSMRLYDFINTLIKSIKDIFFNDSCKLNLSNKLKSDLLDLTGYNFSLDIFENDVIKVSDGYFSFCYCTSDNEYNMYTTSNIVFDNGSDDSYNLFKRLDTYKETHKYIKELLENYIKEL